MEKIKVLFVLPITSRSGSSLYLLSFIRWLVEKQLVEPMILLSCRGSIDLEFKKLGKIFYYHENIKTSDTGIVNWFRNRMFYSNIGKKIYLIRLKFIISSIQPELVYSNTIVNGEMLDFCRGVSAPVITHVHESEYLISLYGEENLQLIKKYSTRYIACSQHVLQSLEKVDIPRTKISVVYSSIRSDLSKPAQTYCAEINVNAAIKNKKKIIGGSGGLGWLKGSDLVIPLMKELLKKEQDICFLWVGGDPTSLEYQQMLLDIKNAGLANHIIITGTVSDSLYYFSLMKVFVLLSREDSFPLVCLENGLLSNPVVCFEKGGGAEEFLKECTDNILPYLDTISLSERILQLLNDTATADKIGISLRNRVLDNFTSEKLFPELFKIMQHSISTAGKN